MGKESLAGGRPAAGLFLLLAQKKGAKEKGTRLRCPTGALASSLKPGDAETRFAITSKEAKLEHPHRC
jgi:hypothetical protein